LMAGPGRCIIEDTLEEFDGSPLLSLAAPTFTSHVFVEEHAGLMSALQQRVLALGAGLAPTYVPADCNAPDSIERIRRATPNRGLSLAFLDNLGLDVAFDTIRTLTEGRRIDLAITFQVSDLRRNVGNAFTDETKGRRFDLFFGSPHWREVLRAFEAGGLHVPNVETALTNHYADRLATIGYPHIAQLHTLMKNDKGAALYRVILAAKHDRATDFFQKISKKPYSKQGALW